MMKIIQYLTELPENKEGNHKAEPANTCKPSYYSSRQKTKAYRITIITTYFFNNSFNKMAKIPDYFFHPFNYRLI